MIGTVLRWIADYWYIPVFAVLVITGWVVLARFRSGQPPIQPILDELKTIKAGREARALQARADTDTAKAHVQAKYAETRKRLNAEAAAKMERLENDPEKLARYLDRVDRELRRSSGT